MAKQGLLVVISGPSGAGKGTIVHELLAQDRNLCVSVSATTRSPRPGEVDGTHYYFMDKAKFTQLVETDGMLEHAVYCDNFYGTPRGPVDAARAAGRDVILEIEVQGAMQIKQKCPDCITIFILPPSREVLEKRLRDRGTEDEATVQKRMSQLTRELGMVQHYDYAVVNGELEKAVDDVCAILRAEHCRTCYTAPIQ